mmetsp:Transcript_4756/g.13620  ORF Transcript_4756/g.13620 Transcript_4756/m.13620 type:complete len:257 (+) Transcript_4756:1051-1821(+)
MTRSLLTSPGWMRWLTQASARPGITLIFSPVRAMVTAVVVRDAAAVVGLRSMAERRIGLNSQPLASTIASGQGSSEPSIARESMKLSRCAGIGRASRRATALARIPKLVSEGGIEECPGGTQSTERCTLMLPFSTLPTSAMGLSSRPGRRPLVANEPSSRMNASWLPLPRRDAISLAMCCAPWRPPTSSSWPYARKMVRGGCCTPDSRSCSTARSCMMTLCLLSMDPRPHTVSLSSMCPLNGGCSQRCAFGAGTTS